MDGPDAADVRDDGFSIVEVMVAMVLLAIMALSFLPLVTRATTAAATSSSVATASRLVSEQMEIVRAAPVTVCADRAGAVVKQVADARGGTFDVRTDIDGACPGDGIITFDVWVTHSGAPERSRAIASASTRLAMVGS